MTGPNNKIGEIQVPLMNKKEFAEKVLGRKSGDLSSRKVILKSYPNYKKLG
jgi:hypothetical protein